MGESEGKSVVGMAVGGREAEEDEVEFGMGVVGRAGVGGVGIRVGEREEEVEIGMEVRGRVGEGDVGIVVGERLGEVGVGLE